MVLLHMHLTSVFFVCVSIIVGVIMVSVQVQVGKEEKLCIEYFHHKEKVTFVDMQMLAVAGSCPQNVLLSALSIKSLYYLNPTLLHFF